MKFIDAHTHIQFLAYEADRSDVLNRAREAGVRMITVGTQAATSEAGIALAEKYPEDVWATVGFHPAHANIDWFYDKNEQREAASETFDAEKLRGLARHPRVVAIGECGLDYFRVAPEHLEATKTKQREAFLAQIEIAHELKKPLMIHCRQAFDDLIDILKSEVRNLKSDAPGVIHFFTGTKDDAKRLLDMGFAFTFGGVVTFSRDYNEVIKMITLDTILSETDAPYVAPAPYRGKRNEPAYVVEVVKKLADIKSVPLEKMAEQIFANTQKVFGI